MNTLGLDGRGYVPVYQNNWNATVSRSVIGINQPNRCYFYPFVIISQPLFSLERSLECFLRSRFRSKGTKSWCNGTWHSTPRDLFATVSPNFFLSENLLVSNKVFRFQRVIYKCLDVRTSGLRWKRRKKDIKKNTNKHEAP